MVKLYDDGIHDRRVQVPQSVVRSDVRTLDDRITQALKLLQRAKRLHYNPRIVDQAIRVLEGNDGPLDLG